MKINIAFGRGGLSSPHPEWSRNDSSELGGSGVIYANLNDENGTPTGVSMSGSASFTGQGTSAATVGAGDWPVSVFTRHAYITSATSRTLTFTGLPVNTPITLKIAGHRGSSPTRDLNFTWGGVAGFYDQSGTNLPTEPTEVVANSNGSGDIVLVVESVTTNETTYLSGLSLEYDSPSAPTAKISYYLSDTNSTTATVSVRAIGGGSVQLKYSINSDFSESNTTIANFVDSSSDYVTKFSLSGLLPDTVYYYQAVQNGFDDLSLTAAGAVIPKFRTGSNGALNFRIGLSSCALTASTSTVFNRIRAKNPDLFMHHGDLHYADITTNDLNLKRAAYLNSLQSKTQNNLFRSCSLLYRYDDHDYGNNNSGGTYVGKVNSAFSVREIFPQSRVNSTGSIESVTTRGRVKFVQLDTRYEKNGATILGASQLSWFKSLLTSTALEILAGDMALIIVDVSIPWIASSGGDTWQDAVAERTEIADHIWSQGLQNNIIFVAGDMHGCAYDNGTNNKFDSSARTGWPVIQSGALDNTGSTKGGPYTAGAFANGGQYSILDISDEDTQLVGTVTAYSPTDTVLYTTSFIAPAVAFTPPTIPSLSINDVSVNEGDTVATFTVVLSAPASQMVSVNYVSSNGSATAGSDYSSVSGTLIFELGETSKNITVSISDDDLDEVSESFIIHLNSPTNATIETAMGVATIVDNDSATENIAKGKFNAESISSYGAVFTKIKSKYF